ncbi:unnamed protein product [Effrenium voratum]|nr:unnamed protein product [Effrenium voratum]
MSMPLRAVIGARLGAVRCQRRWYKIRVEKKVYTGYERLRLHKEAFKTAAEPIIESQMYTPEVLKPDNLTKCCHRLVAFQLHQPELLERYAVRAEELAAQLVPLQFSLILNAFARAFHRHDQMLTAFSKRMLPKLHQFQVADIARTCNAYAKLREQDEARLRRCH